MAILIQVTANGVKGDFILDTGAGVHVFSNSFLHKLNPQAAGHYTGFRNTGERIDFDLFQIASLSIGHFRQENPVVAAWDVLDKFKIDGVLSAKFFVHHVVTLDFKRHELHPLVKITNKKRRSAADIAAEIMMSPTEAAKAEINRRKKIYVIVDTDFAMRKKHGAYEEATRKGELWLRSLAEETGGLVFIPRSLEEMAPRADEIAREIDSQYVVTYTPKRPLAEATVEAYRRINVASGLIGLHVHTRHGYVARAQ